MHDAYLSHMLDSQELLQEASLYVESTEKKNEHGQHATIIG